MVGFLLASLGSVGLGWGGRGSGGVRADFGGFVVVIPTYCSTLILSQRISPALFFRGRLRRTDGLHIAD